MAMTTVRVDSSTMRITADDRQLLRVVRDLQKRQVPFAKMKAANEIADMIQKTQRAEMKEHFTIRRPRFVDLSVKRKGEDFATKSRPHANVRIETPGGTNKGQLWTQHEEGMTRKPDGNSFTIPMGRLRGKVISRTSPNKPVNLKFQPVGTGGNVFIGQRDTILIRTADGGGIYRRTGKRVADARERIRAPTGRFMPGFEKPRTKLSPLFGLVREAPLKPRLGFERTSRVVFRANWRPVFDRWLQHAIATAKKSG
jgi:hypothetical protein